MTETFTVVSVDNRRPPMLSLDKLSSRTDLNEAVRKESLSEKLMFLDTASSKPDLRPPVGPNPMLLSRKEVDALYDLLEVLQTALGELQIQYVVTAGTLLGAIRSESFLFNDDDINISIVDDGKSYDRLTKDLPKLLKEATGARNELQRSNLQFTYHERPFEACDRVKSSVTPLVSVNILVLRKYESVEELSCLVSQNDNGEDRPADVVDQIHADMPDAEYPLYHFNNRKAIELWPREYITPKELFPVIELKFGHLTVPGPGDSIGVLRRFYGGQCFTHYTIAQHEGGDTHPSVNARDMVTLLPLRDEHFCPVQCSRRNKRVWSSHCREALETKLALYDEYRAGLATLPTPSRSFGSMSRSKSHFAIPDERNSPTEVARAAIEPETTRWFGADVRRCIGDSQKTPNFDQSLRTVMEPHIRKARASREKSTSKSTLKVDASIASAVGVPYTSLRKERPFLFDEYSHPLHQMLAETLEVEDLSKLHESPIQDKHALLEPMLRSSCRRRFHECYDNFVTSFCIPLVHSIAMTRNVFHSTSPNASTRIRYRYQAFPCIRVVRPGELSVGPHCDTAYGHSIGSLNFHVPLTAVFGTNALYTESHPGREDWHPLTTKSVGLGYIFDGARCLHFTLENTTPVTRVSIDFRISIYRNDNGHTDNCNTGLCTRAMLEDNFSRAGPGYYDEASIDLGPLQHHDPVDSTVARKEFPDLFEPDSRVGFPFAC